MTDMERLKVTWPVDQRRGRVIKARHLTTGDGGRDADFGFPERALPCLVLVNCREKLGPAVPQY